MRTALPIITTVVLAFASSAHAENISNDTPSAASSAQAAKKSTLSRPDPLVLVDANGKVVGTYLPVTDNVILHVQNALIVADVTNQFDVNAPFASLGEQSGSTYRWAIRGQTWYLSADCSGPPIPLANAGLRPVAYTQDRNSGALTAYIGGIGRSTAKRANSMRQAALGGGPQSGQCLQQAPFGGSIQGFDVESVFNLSQRFPEALSVK